MRLFRKQENQDEKLIRNMKRYEQKEKAKQQESKILGQKLIKRATNSKESTNVHNSSRM
jgi:hypothetical protein|tara:strand:+ start:153 stop:329 length:177 start_codon:yes stop_codon:yes gene_type:complete